MKALQSPINVGIALVVGILLGIAFSKLFTRRSDEGFDDNVSLSALQKCNICNRPRPCGCQSGQTPSSNGTQLSRCPPCPSCREPDLSKYVLKSTIPPCQPCPNMSNYMLKTECPPVPDLSKYVLKSSIPRPQPVILDCSKCAKSKGECPPCPRPRCPEVMCPEPVKCPPPAPCPRPRCPAPVVKCRTEEPVQNIRPFLAPLSTMGFGLG